MKYNGLIKGSKTIDATALTAGLGAIIQYMPMVKDQLADYYGFIFIALSAVFAILRKVTTKPLGEK